MPFVKIDLFEGRTEEQKIELAREVTEVVSRVAKAPKEAIHVFINDMPEGTYYPHGEMKKKNQKFKKALTVSVVLGKRQDGNYKRGWDKSTQPRYLCGCNNQTQWLSEV